MATAKPEPLEHTPANAAQPQNAKPPSQQAPVNDPKFTDWAMI
ncbi:hypothetical protein [Shimia sp. R10_1]|nr:hypothetical protein [Shimia sp. R10_1]